MIHAFPSFVCRALVRWPSLISVLVGCLLAVTAQAQDDDPGGSPSYVVYDPNMVTSLQGVAPLKHSYQLTITSPSIAVSGVSTPIKVEATVELAPAGVSLAVAKDFVTFSSDTLSYSGPGESQTITVNVSIPVGTEDGQFRYCIKATGWSGPNLVNNGTYINMTVTPPASFPPATVTVDSPAAGATFTHVLGGPDLSIPISATGKASNSNPVDEVAVTVTAVDSAGLTIALPAVKWNSTGSGTAQQVVSTQFPVTLPGVYTVNATARDHLGGTATAASTFTVNQVVPAPVVVFTQTPGAVYDYYLGSPALQIPFAFQGTSLKGSIQSLTATLNNVPVAFTPTGLATLTASGSGTLSLSAGGDYTLVVTATTENGTGTATTEFHVNALVPTTFAVHGGVFFDVNADGHRQVRDFGLPGIAVTLVAANGVRTDATTAADGLYAFNVAPGTYRLVVQPMKGFDFTTPNSWTINVTSSAVTVADCGMRICFNDLWTMRADGCTIGFWKNNVSKALGGGGCGAQISPANIRAYTTAISSLALEPFDGITPAQALARFRQTSCSAKDLLAKQLLAAEYNYEKGAYIGGNAILTYCFVYWGEYALDNAAADSRSHLLHVKDWMEAYNSSHGWVVLGPLNWFAVWDGHSDCGHDEDHDHGACDSHDDDSHRGCGGH